MGLEGTTLITAGGAVTFGGVGAPAGAGTRLNEEPELVPPLELMASLMGLVAALFTAAAVPLLSGPVPAGEVPEECEVADVTCPAVDTLHGTG